MVRPVFFLCDRPTRGRTPSGRVDRRSKGEESRSGAAEVISVFIIPVFSVCFTASIQRASCAAATQSPSRSLFLGIFAALLERAGMQDTRARQKDR